MKKHDKIVLLAKSKLNSNASIDSNISHDKSILINNLLKECYDMIIVIIIMIIIDYI